MTSCTEIPQISCPQETTHLFVDQLPNYITILNENVRLKSIQTTTAHFQATNHDVESHHIMYFETAFIGQDPYE